MLYTPQNICRSRSLFHCIAGNWTFIDGGRWSDVRSNCRYCVAFEARRTNPRSCSEGRQARITNTMSSSSTFFQGQMIWHVVGCVWSQIICLTKRTHHYCDDSFENFCCKQSADIVLTFVKPYFYLQWKKIISLHSLQGGLASPPHTLSLSLQQSWIQRGQLI